MANFREFNARLATMSGMRRVTATMKMVAASHLHRAQNEMKLPEPFAAELAKLSAVVQNIPSFSQHKLFRPPQAENASVLLIVLASDRGLCGSFNSNLAHEVRRWVAEERGKRTFHLDTLYLGVKGFSALGREFPPCRKPVALSAHPKIGETAPTSTYATDRFLDGTYSEVWLAGCRFVSTLKHDPEVRRVLPYAPNPIAANPRAKASASNPYADAPLIEPRDDRMVEAIMRQAMHYFIYVAELNRVASEQASRVMSMENATVNLRSMEKELTLQRNRARQSQITNELTEIVSGAESLG